MQGFDIRKIPKFTPEQQRFVGECLLLGLKHREIARQMRYIFPDFGSEAPDDIFERVIMDRLKRDSESLRIQAQQARLAEINSDDIDTILLDARRLWLDLEDAKRKIPIKEESAAWARVADTQIKLLNMRIKYTVEKPKEPPATVSDSGDEKASSSPSPTPLTPPRRKHPDMKDRSGTFSTKKMEDV